MSKIRFVIIVFIVTLLTCFYQLGNLENTQFLRKINIDKELTHTCINDEFNQDIDLEIPPYQELPYEETQEQELERLRMGKEPKWRNMKILLDYSNLKTTDVLEDFIKTRLINYSMDFISSVYKVHPTKKIDEVKGHRHKCGYLQIPEEHRQNGIEDHDLVIYVATLEGVNKHWLAASQPCRLSRRNHRTVAGTLFINSWFLNKTLSSGLTTQKILSWQGVLIHEQTHLLGFMGLTFNLLQKRRHIDLFEKGKHRYHIVNPKVVDFAREFWNCPKAKGVPLENNGGLGNVASHWEKSAFAPELMTGSAVVNFYYSDFTLKTLEASKWYLTDSSRIQPFSWGKGEGCGLAKSRCKPNGLEFCSLRTPQGTLQCSPDYMGVAHCYKRDALCPHCGIWNELGVYDCRSQDSRPEFIEKVELFEGVLGGQSRCFDIVDMGQSCYLSQCSNDSVIFEIGKRTYECKKDDKELNVTINNQSYTIKCPNHAHFCTYRNEKCKQSCNNRGNCINGLCHCHAGFKGEYCQETDRQLYGQQINQLQI